MDDAVQALPQQPLQVPAGSAVRSAVLQMMTV
jgi:hypothetical protein